MLLFSDLSLSRCFDSQHSANHRVCRLLGPLLDHDDHHRAAAPPSLPAPARCQMATGKRRFGHGSPSRSLARSEQQTHLVLSASSSRLNKGRTGSPETVHYQHRIANRVFARISPPAATGCEPIQPSSPYRDPGRAPACWQMYAKRTRPSTRRIVPK